MSKMDNLRAMREAKYAETAKRTAAAAKNSGLKPSGGAPKAVSPAAPTPRQGTRAEATAASSGDTAGAAEPALCGHRNMSGRTCTREHGHAAKSHRYS